MHKQAILLALALSAIGAPAFAASVTGSVTYRERIALPQGYVLRVELRDISRQDAASEEIASIEMRPRRQVPIRYALRYDPRRIDPAHMYSVSARILIDGRLAFISTRINSVLTRGASNKADIMLQAVGRPPQ
ncbi:YbaY family lipoprotein [Methylocystis parvus]|uniref:YbaY family lipoprotein n=1 Tax=Methylocystis parvus TaxID=134 RepID=UPI003C746917